MYNRPGRCGKGCTVKGGAVSCRASVRGDAVRAAKWVRYGMAAKGGAEWLAQKRCVRWGGCAVRDAKELIRGRCAVWLLLRLPLFGKAARALARQRLGLQPVTMETDYLRWQGGTVRRIKGKGAVHNRPGGCGESHKAVAVCEG